MQFKAAAAALGCEAHACDGYDNMRHVGTLVLLCIAAVISGCASAPGPGSVVHARVSIVVDEELFKKVQIREPMEIQKNPHRTQAIQDAIHEGVKITDVHGGRLVLCNCRYGSQSASWFKVLLPGNIDVKEGDHVELLAGIESWKGHPGSLSTFRRALMVNGPMPICAPQTRE